MSQGLWYFTLRHKISISLALLSGVLHHINPKILFYFHSCTQPETYLNLSTSSSLFLMYISEIIQLLLVNTFYLFTKIIISTFNRTLHMSKCLALLVAKRGEKRKKKI